MPPIDTRSRILDVAQELIQRRGVNGMSYSDISEAVGIRKASIHHHFPTKEDLLVALLLRYRSEFQALVDAIVRSNAKPNTKLRKFMNLFHQTISIEQQDKACLCGMLASELLTIGDEPADLVRAFLRDCHTTLVTILQQGIDDQTFCIRGKLADCADLFLVALEGGLIVARADGGAQRFTTIMRQLELSVRNPA